VLKDVSDGEIVGKDRPDQRERGSRDSHKPGDTGPSSGIGEPFGRNSRRLPGGDQPERNTPSQKVIRGQG